MTATALPVVDRLDPIFKTLAPGIGDIPRTPGRSGRDPRIEQGYIHAGPVGAGHFVKMIHNGIEYGLMQAYAEGFDILKNANLETRYNALIAPANYCLVRMACDLVLFRFGPGWFERRRP